LLLCEIQIENYCWNLHWKAINIGPWLVGVANRPWLPQPKITAFNQRVSSSFIHRKLLNRPLFIYKDIYEYVYIFFHIFVHIY
jgi:hypothetical protein